MISDAQGQSVMLHLNHASLVFAQEFFKQAKGHLATYQSEVTRAVIKAMTSN